MSKFEGREELNKILIKLDKWNKKYNKSKDKYLSISCVDGYWQGTNANSEIKKKFIDFFITPSEMEEMSE